MKSSVTFCAVQCHVLLSGYCGEDGGSIVAAFPGTLRSFIKKVVVDFPRRAAHKSRSSLEFKTVFKTTVQTVWLFPELLLKVLT